MNPATLSEYFTAKGRALPSLSSRATDYEALGLGSAQSYRGTAEQNARLLAAYTEQDSAKKEPLAAALSALEENKDVLQTITVSFLIDFVNKYPLWGGADNVLAAILPNDLINIDSILYSMNPSDTVYDALRKILSKNLNEIQRGLEGATVPEAQTLPGGELTPTPRFAPTTVGENRIIDATLSSALAENNAKLNAYKEILESQKEFRSDILISAYANIGAAAALTAGVFLAGKRLDERLESTPFFAPSDLVDTIDSVRNSSSSLDTSLVMVKFYSNWLGSQAAQYASGPYRWAWKAVEHAQEAESWYNTAGTFIETLEMIKKSRQSIDAEIAITQSRIELLEKKSFEIQQKMKQAGGIQVIEAPSQAVRSTLSSLEDSYSTASSKASAFDVGTNASLQNAPIQKRVLIGDFQISVDNNIFKAGFLNQADGLGAVYYIVPDNSPPNPLVGFSVPTSTAPKQLEANSSIYFSGTINYDFKIQANFLGNIAFVDSAPSSDQDRVVLRGLKSSDFIFTIADKAAFLDPKTSASPTQYRMSFYGVESIHFDDRIAFLASPTSIVVQDLPPFNIATRFSSSVLNPLGTSERVFYGTSSDEIFIPLGGNDTIFGGAGVDTLRLDGPRRDYIISGGAETRITSKLDGSYKVVFDVEKVSFSDKEVGTLSTYGELAPAILNQLSSVYFGRGLGYDARSTLAEKVSVNFNVNGLQNAFNLSVADGRFKTSDSSQVIVQKTFENIFGTAPTAFEVGEWSRAVASGIVTREALPWTIFNSYLGATNVPAVYQVPAQSRLVAIEAFTNVVQGDVDKGVGSIGSSLADTARAWLFPIKTQSDAGSKVNSVQRDVSEMVVRSAPRYDGLIDLMGVPDGTGFENFNG